jgi:hypothetical protein
MNQVEMNIVPHRQDLFQTPSVCQKRKVDRGHSIPMRNLGGVLQIPFGMLPLGNRVLGVSPSASLSMTTITSSKPPNLEEVGLHNLVDNVIGYIKSSQLPWVNDLIGIIQQISQANPYPLATLPSTQPRGKPMPRPAPLTDRNSRYHLMWEEQCGINFPLLYLSSLCLYFYAKQNECDTFLFATRDCCHWVKIFKKMFPETNCHYFDCSRNMFKKATDHYHPIFRKYVKSLIKKDINKTIYVDLHGTGLHLFSYFKKEFERFPHCFLLSASSKTFEQLPEICQIAHKQGHLSVIVFAAGGTPIEMLNYDIIGTLQDYTSLGPVRDQLEYPINRLEPYHVSMDLMISQIQSIEKSRSKKGSLMDLSDLINKIYLIIQHNIPVIGTYIEHQIKHPTTESHKKETLQKASENASQKKDPSVKPTQSHVELHKETSQNRRERRRSQDHPHVTLIDP